MPIFSRKQLIEAYNSTQRILLEEGGERRFASRGLKQLAESYSLATSYDIFLSHSYDDARVIRAIRDYLVQAGYKVYVDWIDDDDLERENVTEQTAERLRARMHTSKSLLYATSESAAKSRWMPWELGYMDAYRGRVGIVPISDVTDSFRGREYLGLYPYLDMTGNTFWMHKNANRYIRFDTWITGKNP